MLRYLFVSTLVPIVVAAASRVSTRDLSSPHVVESGQSPLHRLVAGIQVIATAHQNARADSSLAVDDIVNPIISDMKQDFATNPLVLHLKKIKSSNATEEVPFLPYMTFFINSFSDINRMILPYPEEELDSGDEEAGQLKALINEHCKEDSTHHYLFWRDLEHYDSFLRDRVGLHNVADIVRFLWSDDLYDIRKLSYEVARLAGMASKPIHRYCMIRVMEEVGNVFFTTGVDYTMIGGIPSAYMGHDHLDLENGHLQSHKNQTESANMSCYDDHVHEDALTQVFGSMRFQSAEECNTAKHVMKATYKLFDDMLLSAHNAMRKQSEGV